MYATACVTLKVNNLSAYVIMYAVVEIDVAHTNKYLHNSSHIFFTYVVMLVFKQKKL